MTTLAEHLMGPHEWGYRDPVVGGFIEDNTPFDAAARIAEMEAGWRHIESAPKDETWVMLFFPEPHRPWQAEAGGIVLGFWSSEFAAWFASEAANNALNEHYEPSHWMPLPASILTGTTPSQSRAI